MSDFDNTLYINCFEGIRILVEALQQKHIDSGAAKKLWEEQSEHDENATIKHFARALAIHDALSGILSVLTKMTPAFKNKEEFLLEHANEIIKRAMLPSSLSETNPFATKH